MTVFGKNSLIKLGCCCSYILCALLIFFAYAKTAGAQENKEVGRQMGVKGFLDEDGDGFNDLLPDQDGDGVPDALDPDFKGRNADSAYMHQHMYDGPDSGQMMHNMNGWSHGEPGMYGPGDSTGHGGMCPGDSMGGHHGGMDGGGMNPDTSGMGGGGHGPGPGKSGGNVSVKDESVPLEKTAIFERETPKVETGTQQKSNR